MFCLSGFSKTAYYSYSTNGGNTWSSWISCYCTGSDGSNSFETIIAYNVPFNQDSADQNKIKFKIKDIAGNVGYSNESTVKIDSTPPYTTYTLSGEMGNNGWYISNVTVTLNATDNTSGIDTLSIE